MPPGVVMIVVLAGVLAVLVAIVDPVNMKSGLSHAAAGVAVVDEEGYVSRAIGSASAPVRNGHSQ